MSNSTPPIQIDYPQHAYGSGYITTGTPSPTLLGPNSESNVAQVVSQGAVADSLTQIVPIPTGINTCFRDTVLVALFALKPFVGYIEEVANTIPPSGLTNGAAERASLVLKLQEIIQEYWRSGIDGNSKRKVLADLADKLHQLFNGFGDSDPNAQDDAPLYMQALLQKLDPGFPLESDLADSFPLLFWNQFVARNAYECNCTTKSREPQHRVNDDRLLCPIIINKNNPTIGDAFAWSLYDRQGENDFKCPQCGKMARQHRFLKYRYLPEVLILQLEYPTDTGHSLRNAGFRCLLPEELDLNALHDKIDRDVRLDIDDAALRDTAQRDLTNNQGETVNVAHDSKYKLQSVIDYSGTGTAGHYRCSVRLANNQWLLLDGIGRRNVAKPTTLKAVEADPHFQPRMIAYVRQHAESGNKHTTAGPTSKAVPKHHPTKPDAAAGDATPQSEQENPAGTVLEEQNALQPEVIASEIPLAPAPQGSYDAWDNKRLKDEIAQRGLAMPAKKDAHALRGLLQKHDLNPKEYGLMTTKHLKEEMRKRNLFPAGKKTLVKQEMIKILGDDDVGLVPPAQNVSSLPQPAEMSTNIEYENLKARNRTLEAEKLAWLKEKEESTDSQYELFRDFFARAAAEVTSVKSELANAKAELEDARDRADEAEEEVSTLRRQRSDPQAPIQKSPVWYPDDELLSVSFHVTVPPTAGQIGSEVHAQYVIICESQDSHDYKRATVTMTAMEDSKDPTTLLIQACVNIPNRSKDGAPLQHTIDLPIHNQSDRDGLRMSAVTSVVTMNAPLCVRWASNLIALPSATNDPDVNWKRKRSQIDEQDGSMQTEHPSKKQKA